MNNQIIELTKKVLEAQEMDTHFKLDLELTTYCTALWCRVGINKARTCTGITAYKNTDNYEGELNFIEASVDYFLKYGELQQPFHIELAKKLMLEAWKKEPSLTDEEVAEYMNVPVEVLNFGSASKAI